MQAPYPKRLLALALQYDSKYLEAFFVAPSWNPDRRLNLVGGYDLNGNLIIQNQTYYDGRAYVLPDVWTATRVDSATPCYSWTPISVFGNSIDITTQLPPLTGLAHMGSIFIPSSGYNSGFYTTFDHSCVGSGPISSSDISISRLLAGGVYFDIDRTQLGATENIILNLTFLPLGPKNLEPNQTQLSSSESAYFKIHLIRTGQTAAQIQQVLQPRFLTYANTTQYPEVATNLAIITPPNGQIRQEQVMIPLTLDSTIDRIRLERYSGNAILIDATVMRLGVPSSQ